MIVRSDLYILYIQYIQLLSMIVQSDLYILYIQYIQFQLLPAVLEHLVDPVDPPDQYRTLFYIIVKMCLFVTCGLCVFKCYPRQSPPFPP